MSKAVKLSLMLAGFMIVAGCQTAPKPLYQWESYQPQVYEYFKGEPKEQQVEAERVIEATEQALAIDASLLDEAERTALDAAIAALRSAAQGQDSRAIKIQLEAFNRASNEFASRRMDKSIRQALAGHKIDEIRI